MIDLNPHHLGTVQRILAEHVPACEIRAFGSRATWTAKDYSDLDLAVVGEGPLERRTLARLKEAFEESDLPMRVDVLDWHTISMRFRAVIARDYVVLQQGADGQSAAASEWSTATIDDIAEKVAMGPFGSSIKVETFVSEGIPIISGQHLHGSRVDDGPGFNFISPEHAQRLANANVMRGDIVLTHRGTIGQVAYIPENSKFDRYVVSQSQFYIRCDRSKVVPEFVAIYLRSPEGQHQLLANTSQVGVPSIAQPVTYLRTMEIPLPPLPEQRAIADVLGTLDDKIELNRRMNETLEAMARALFQDWFVDFGPTRAKLAGRAPYLPPELWALFPDRLVESELGEIPSGWEVQALPKAVEINPRRSLRKGAVAPYLDMANMPTQSHTPNAVVERPFGSGMRFTNGDTLVARITPCLENGKTAYVDFLQDSEVGWGSTEYIVMRPQPPLPYEFAYCLARSRGFREFAIQRMTGTSGRQRVPAKALAHYEWALPISPQVPEAFGDFVKPLFTRASMLSEESRTLAFLRDTLLPRLVSGEVQMKEVSRLTKETG